MSDGEEPIYLTDHKWVWGDPVYEGYGVLIDPTQVKNKCYVCDEVWIGMSSDHECKETK